MSIEIAKAGEEKENSITFERDPKRSQNSFGGGRTGAASFFAAHDSEIQAVHLAPPNSVVVR